MTHRQRLYLSHVVECLDRIDDYLPSSKERFLEDTMRQDALIRMILLTSRRMKRIFQTSTMPGRTCAVQMSAPDSTHERPAQTVCGANT